MTGLEAVMSLPVFGEGGWYRRTIWSDDDGFYYSNSPGRPREKTRISESVVPSVDQYRQAWLQYWIVVTIFDRDPIGEIPEGYDRRAWATKELFDSNKRKQEEECS